MPDKLNDYTLGGKPREVLVIGTNGCWAKAATIKEARQKAHRPKHYNAYAVVEGTRVSDIGSLLYPGDPEADRPILLEKR